jgi:3-phenylpropionate/trans-cinnamate dioxygenase ferredoxin reductase component
MMVDSTRYLIVGGGLAGGSAVEAIRAGDQEGRIVLVSDEKHLPYDRVALSKGYLMGKLHQESLFLQDAEFYQQQQVDVLLGRRVQRLNTNARTALLDDGRELEYERLLLATGGRARRPPIPGSDLSGIYCLRTIEDSDAIRTAMSSARHALVIGGGFIGCEIAAACKQQGLDTTIVEVLPSLLSLPLDQETAQWVTKYFIEQGVHVLTNETAARFVESNGRVAGIETKTGKTIPADFVAVGIGITPNVELAKEAGLPVNNGIVVNEQLRVDDTSIYAAGDIASFYSPLFGRHLRLEHYDVAAKHGEVAGANMAGGQERFTELPHFFSSMFKLRIEVWGDATQRDTVVRRGPLELSDKGGFAQFYLSQERVQAYLSVNRSYKEAEPAKNLILSRKPVKEVSLLGNESVDLNNVTT